jgi:hypothetical protein
MSSYWDFLPTRLLTRNTFPEAALDLLQSKAMVRPIAAEPAAAHAPTMQACGAPADTSVRLPRRQHAAPCFEMNDNGLAAVRRRKRTQYFIKYRQQRPWRARASRTRA